MAKKSQELLGIECLQTANIVLYEGGKKPVVSRRIQAGERYAFHPEDVGKILKQKKNKKPVAKAVKK